MEFTSPIVSGSGNSRPVSRRVSTLGRSLHVSTMSDSILSPNRFDNSGYDGDFLGQTVFDNDPTFTRIGTQRKFLDDTRFDLTCVSRKRGDENMISVLLEEETPGVEHALELFEGFLKIFQAFSSDHQIFNQIAEYESQCSEQLDLLNKLIQIAPQGHSKIQHAKELQQELRMERDTWRLVTSLYQDRLNSECQDSEMEEEYWVGLDDTTSEQDLVKQLYEKSVNIRQAQLVVDWLERRAADVYYDSHYNQMEFYGDAVAGWENTLHILSNRGTGSSVEDRNLITEMDPDAPGRQPGKRLHPVDREDEIRLLRSVFSRLRCGQLEEAQQLCFRAGQPHRAALLEGWKLFHDPNMRMASEISNLKEPASGNPYRDIWKSMAWKQCSNNDLAADDRAILGLMCGHLESLLPTCESWEDYLWVYLRAMIDRSVEKELRRCVNYKRQLELLPDEYWNQQLTVEGIFAKLASSTDKEMIRQGRDQYRIIQRYIITDNVDGVLEEMSSWLNRDMVDVPLGPHMLRLMAHLALFFRRCGRGSNDDAISAIVEAYVQRLVQLSRTDLVAGYVAQLTVAEDQVRLYAQCLVMAEEHAECSSDEHRRELLNLAQLSGLDVSAIAKRVVAAMCHQSENNYANDASLQIASTPDDERRIRSLGWLLIDPSMRSSLLIEANKLMRGFLLRRQIEAVKLTFQAIPADTISVLSEQWQSRTGLTELPVAEQSAIREYICVKAYLDALDAFQEWFTRFHHSKPQKSKTQKREVQRGGNAQLSFTENLLKEQHNKQHQAELQRWKTAVESLAQSAIDKLYNVLLFPDGGWMADPCQEEEDDLRHEQLELLRKTCVPHSALILCNVLTSMQQYGQCLELANVIAADSQALYKVFTSEQLSQITAHLRRAYVKVLDLGQMS